MPATTQNASLDESPSPLTNPGVAPPVWPVTELPPTASAVLPPLSTPNNSVPPRKPLPGNGTVSSEIKTSTTPAQDMSPILEAPSPTQLPTASGKLEANGQENGNDALASVPQGRRSVQFARRDGVPESASHSRQPSWEDPDGGNRSKPSSFISKLKALAVTGALQTQKSPSVDPQMASQSLPSSPIGGRYPSRNGHLQNEGGGDSDADADAEETADEAAAEEVRKAMKEKKQRAKKMRRPRMPDFASTPNTPIHKSSADATNVGRRFVSRRASLSGPSDMQHHHRELSDGEGRDDAARDLWRRGTSWISGPNRTNTGEEADDVDSPTGKRMGHFRRMTYFGGGTGGGGMSDGDNTTPRRTFFSTDRASSFAVPRWPAVVKNTIKLWRTKKDDRFDYTKSAELMAELRAGAPAAVMLASMIQRDEHGNKRIPVLLEQLKVRVSDSTAAPESDKPDKTDSDRHWVFTLDLEYGSGPSRMKWQVIRTLRDIYELHLRYKFAFAKDIQRSLPGGAGSADYGSRRKQPKFPLSTFPYLRGVRGLADADESDEEGVTSQRGEETADEGTAGEGTASEMDVRGGRRRSRIMGPGHRRLRSTFTDQGDLSAAEGSVTGQTAAQAAFVIKQRHIERQRRLLEKYLQDMIRWLMFRADSNRLCRFLELSALGVRLAAEGSFHGKECYLHIQSSKGMDFRRVLTPKKVIARHSRKWFLVRESYIVCVESPENMIIYDVYLVDPKFTIISKKSTLKQIGEKMMDTADPSAAEEKPQEKREAKHPKHHTLTIQTSERKVKLFARKEVVMTQFEESVRTMLKNTRWHEKNRFDSFAPVRTGVFAEWLVDGRDYMWNVSRAINMARNVIYIHDWWLSPELYLRRPAAISQKWRLDRLLQRKAREGVKIFVIIYRNVESAIPIDSEYTKISLHNLHPNIFVQRSPNQFKKNQLFFAHHEKLCIVDHDIVFLGGIDLCFGRWDCPQHPLEDDKPTGFEDGGFPADPANCQVFLGKDYSNPRVHDFFRLHQPYDDMYDRKVTPRMPWHDVGMQLAGQPARDLTRHFVQRWNYLRRGRKPTRALPFLLPPPDSRPGEYKDMGLSGTCEVQILRSAAAWSLGTYDTEVSIQNAYVKMIEDSEHFVYIENQFFVTSTQAYNTKVVNRIGDALVDRIIRAYQNQDDWKCFILIPLMPGFESTVDEQPGMSVRLIVQFQYRSICRGESSIFERLRAVGIDPEDYIQFYSLRKWGKLHNDILVTEQLYIHAKIIIADDRVALIGSANINERSMLGNRDSEVAAIIRDTDMIWSTMGGKPYQVSRFAHTLRMRLMREHLGLDVDEIEAEERQIVLDREAEMSQQAQFEQDMDKIYGETKSPEPSEEQLSPKRPPLMHVQSFNRDAEPPTDEDDRASIRSKGKQVEFDPRITGNVDHEREVAGFGEDRWKTAAKLGVDQGRDSIVVDGREVLLHNISPEGKGTLDSPKKFSNHHHHNSRPLSSSRQSDIASSIDPGDRLPPVPALNRRTTEQLGLPRASQLPTLPALDDTDIGGPPAIPELDGRDEATHPLAADIKLAYIDKNCMRDPLNPSFFEDVWNRTAENNTRLYREVFRCMPDSEVKTWGEYRDFTKYANKFHMSQMGLNKIPKPQSKGGEHGPPATEQVSEKVTSSGLDSNPAIIIPTEDETELDEKKASAAENGGEQASKNRPTPGLDLEKIVTAYSQDQPSPVLPPGDIPFPALEQQPTHTTRFLDPLKEKRRTTFLPSEKPASRDTSGSVHGNVGSMRRRRRGTTKTSRRGLVFEDVLSRDEAEELLGLTRGNLVQFPYDWLVTEESNANWGYHLDGMAPISI